jgi:hypothetical protein
MTVVPYTQQRLRDFGVMLRDAFGASNSADKLGRHLLHKELNDLWFWVDAHPETLKGPHVAGVVQ